MAEPDVSSEEYRAQAVAWFLSSEKTIAEIANTLSLSESVVREWVWNATPEDVSDDARPDSDAAVRVEADASFAKTAATNAAAVEAVLRAEMLAAEAVARAEAKAAEAVARAEAVAAEAKAAAADVQGQLEMVRAELEAARAEIAVRIAAEAAAREEMTAVYAEAVEAIARAEAVANGVAPAKAILAEAVTEAGAVEPVPHSVTADDMARGGVPAVVEALVQAGEVRNDTVGTSQLPSSTAPVVPASSTPGHLDRSEAEAEARAKIAEVMARARPVDLWVHATGRTLEAATAEVLDRLGVDEEHAEIEVLANGSRWLPGRVQVRARVRGRTELRLITKPAGPGPVASAGPGPADGRG